MLRGDGTLVTWNPEMRIDVLDLAATPLATHRVEFAMEGRLGPDNVEIYDGRALLVDNGGVDDQIVDLATGRQARVDMALPDGSRFPASSEPMLVDGGYAAISSDLDVAVWEDGALVARRNISPADGHGLSQWGHVGSRVLVGSGPFLGSQMGQLLDVSDGKIHQMLTFSEDDVVHAAPTADGGFVVVDSTGLLRTYAADGSVVDEFATGVDLNDGLWRIATDGHRRTAFARPGAQRGMTQIDIVDRREDTRWTVPIKGRVDNLGFARQATSW